MLGSSSFLVTLSHFNNHEYRIKQMTICGNSYPFDWDIIFLIDNKSRQHTLHDQGTNMFQRRVAACQFQRLAWSTHIYLCVVKWSCLHQNFKE